jgi:hypothetical protein
VTARKLVATAVALGLVLSLGTTACAKRKGTAQRTGEKIDRALGLDK